jgi:hypothetical protein
LLSKKSCEEPDSRGAINHVPPALTPEGELSQKKAKKDNNPLFCTVKFSYAAPYDSANTVVLCSRQVQEDVAINR